MQAVIAGMVQEKGVHSVSTLLLASSKAFSQNAILHSIQMLHASTLHSQIIALSRASLPGIVVHEVHIRVESSAFWGKMVNKGAIYSLDPPTQTWL